MRVAELWRYPVKSMRGEQLLQTDLTAAGLVGDRLVYVLSGDRIVTSRTRPRLLGLAGTLGADGEPLVDGRPWDDPAVLTSVTAATGDGARLVRAGPERFDVLPLSIVTDGAVEALGVDRRRLRPNIVVGGVDGLAERDWPGRHLRIGTAVIAIVKLRQRCVMTTYDPDTLEQDHRVLRRIVEEFDGSVALDAYVVDPGHARVGDPVQVID